MHLLKCFSKKKKTVGEDTVQVHNNKKNPGIFIVHRYAL